MKVTFFGHNCYVLQGKNVVVVTDPWMTKSGAFFGSWFQWPINHHLIEQLAEYLDTSNKVILYLSHEHQDHFDKETLAKILPSIDFCVVPNYEDKFLRDELSNLGYEVVELNDQNKYFLTEKDYIEFLIVDTGVNHDSTAIIKIDEEVFVNQNDCKIFDRLAYLQDINVDYYAVQFSGATWHPVCYDLSESEKQEISKKKVLSKLVAIRNAIQLIKPEFYLPSAGPAIFPFLADNLSLGKNNIFIHQPDLDKFLRKVDAKLMYLMPGDTLSKSAPHTKPIQPPTSSELSAIKNDLTCEFVDLPDGNLNVDKLISEIEKRTEKIKDIKFGKCPKLLLDWGDGGLEVDISQGTVNAVNYEAYDLPTTYVKITATQKYFHLMSDPRYRWQDIYLSLRATVQRVPDIFNTFINIFLFSDTSNIRTGFVSTIDIKDERITIVNPLNGKNYEISRYCPHNGADLKDARIDGDGNLICPRHSWLFNLENDGRCEKADASINAKEVIEHITLCESISTRLLRLDE